MLDFVGTLYALTGASLLVAALAWVQSKAGGERGERYRARMRGAMFVAVLAGVTAVVIYFTQAPS